MGNIYLTIFQMWTCGSGDVIKEIVDGRPTKTDHNSSPLYQPSAQVSLK